MRENLVVWIFVSCDTGKIQLLNLRVRVLEHRCSSYCTTGGATGCMVACADIREHVALYPRHLVVALGRTGKREERDEYS